MHPPPAHGFPRLVRKKADWGDWVVSPVWIVMEPTAKRTLNGALAVSPRFHGHACSVPNLFGNSGCRCVPMQPISAYPISFVSA